MRKTLRTMIGLVLLAPPLSAGEQLGKPIDVKTTTAIHELLANPEKYLGQDVKIEGKITEVCQAMGCWINVQDPSSQSTIQVKVNDGEIVFPKGGAGKSVVAQGKLEKVVLSREQHIAFLKHEAEERGKAVDTSGIKEGKTIYRIKGQGARIQ